MDNLIHYRYSLIPSPENELEAISSPAVYFVEIHLPTGRLGERLLDQGGVGEWRPDLLAPVEVSVGGQVLADVPSPRPRVPVSPLTTLLVTRWWRGEA